MGKRKVSNARLISMEYEIHLRKEAEADLTEAYEYYENCRENLGSDFLLCVEETLSRISKNPNNNKIVYKEVRRALVKRFPYGVFYIVQGLDILVIGVLHARKSPSHGQKRT